MSVIIKGMKLPKNCLECELCCSNGNGTNEEFICYAGHILLGQFAKVFNGRNKNCPLYPFYEEDFIFIRREEYEFLQAENARLKRTAGESR